MDCEKETLPSEATSSELPKKVGLVASAASRLSLSVTAGPVGVEVKVKVVGAPAEAAVGAGDAEAIL